MNQSFLKRIFFILVFSASVSPCFSIKYYVATNGNDANAGTSLAAPFATLAKAISKAALPGDTIFVRSGTYPTSTNVKISKSGTAAKHMVLTVYMPDMITPDSRPVIDFSAMAVNSSNIGITISGANYWDIYGIIVKGAGDNGMLLQNSVGNTKIEFCSFTRNRDSGLQIRSGSHHILVLNCDSYENADLGAGTSTSGGNADGFAPKLDVGDSVIFRGCRAWLNSDDGWDGYLKTAGSGFPSGMTTFLEDCWAFRNGYYWLDGSTTSSQNGNGFKLGGSDLKNEDHNFVVTRCLAFRNKAKGFDQNNNAGSMYLYNNTAHANLGSNFGFNSTGVTYATGAVLVLINNVSLGSSGVSIRTGSSVTNSNNSFSSSTTSTNFLSLDSAGVTGARGLDGSLPTLNYMRLQTSPLSSYVDGGTTLPFIYYRGDYGLTFNGVSPDMGAFESTPVYTSYNFIGNGNWSDVSQWQYGSKPPATVASGAKIVINPKLGGECYLDIPYTVAPGAGLLIKMAKIFRVPDFFTLQQ